MERHNPFGPPPNELTDLSGTADSVRQPAPRPRIVHLLVWIACTLMYLGLSQLISGTMNGPRVPRFDMSSILQIAHAMSAGAGLGYIGMFFRRRWHGMSFPTHPGEFLAILFGINMLTSLVTRCAVALIGADLPFRLLTVVPYCLVLAIFVNWALRSTYERHWRAFFIVFGVVALFRLALPLSPRLLTVRSLAWIPLIAALAVALFADAKQHVPRPWTHWAGMALQISVWAIKWIAWLIFLQKHGRGFFP